VFGLLVTRLTGHADMQLIFSAYKLPLLSLQLIVKTTGKATKMTTSRSTAENRRSDAVSYCRWRWTMLKAHDQVARCPQVACTR
jgi:hypothetical protein